MGRAIGDCDYGVCGDYNAIGVIHTEVTDLGARRSHFLTAKNYSDQRLSNFFKCQKRPRGGRSLLEG